MIMMKIMTVPVIIIIVMMMNMRIFATAGGFAKRGLDKMANKQCKALCKRVRYLLTANVKMSNSKQCAKDYCTILASVLM